MRQLFDEAVASMIDDLSTTCLRLVVIQVLSDWVANVGDLASDNFENFVDKDDWEGDFEYGEPLFDAQRRDLEDGGEEVNFENHEM